MRKNYLKDKNITYETVSYADTGLKELLSRNRNDIDIKKMENSIEVRAKNGDKLYLKIVRRDKRQSVISEEFANILKQVK